MIDRVLHKWFRIPYTLYVMQRRSSRSAKETIVFIHGIGNSGDAWDDVTKKLPDSAQIITIDLLGFGRSPKPKWAKYDAKLQARSVAATLLRLGIVGRVVVVGHSLGSLVAVQLAKSYPFYVKSLILCSPPLYQYNSELTRVRLPRSDHLLRKLYRSAKNRPEQFIKLSAFAMKYALVNKSFEVTEENIHSYMTALEAMVINQTSFEDALKLKVPTHIIRGTLDPFVIGRNLRELKRSNPHITVQQIIAGHEVKGVFVPPVVRAIHATIKQAK